jgi:hypothetical protein
MHNLLEAHFQRELDVPSVASSREGAGGRANDSVAARRVIDEIRPVQDVEKLRPELQIPRLTLIGVFLCKEKSQLNRPGPVRMPLPTLPR